MKRASKRNLTSDNWRSRWFAALRRRTARQNRALEITRFQVSCLSAAIRCRCVKKTDPDHQLRCRILPGRVAPATAERFRSLHLVHRKLKGSHAGVTHPRRRLRTLRSLSFLSLSQPLCAVGFSSFSSKPFARTRSNAAVAAGVDVEIPKLFVIRSTGALPRTSRLAQVPR